MHLLLIEDDAMLGDSLRVNLERAAYVVDWVRDGKAADAALSRMRFDLVVLDLNLPRRDGLDVLRAMRRREDDTPVIIITARDEVEHRVAGLDAGADDYLVKPFDLDELVARLRALTRRRAGRAQPRIEHLGVCLDPATREVTFEQVQSLLTRREYALLFALMERPGRVWSREELSQRLYHKGESVASNAIEVHVHALRKKLAPDLIRSVRGVGYYMPKKLSERV